MEEIERLMAAREYLAEHAPSPEILERFGQTIKDWEMSCPVYCPESDTLSGLIQLAFTVAIAHDLTEDSLGGFSERYCFENPLLALEELAAWHKRQFNDQRPKGWVAVRKISSPKALRSSFETYYAADYAQELLPYSVTADEPDAQYHYKILGHKDKIMKELGYDEDTIKHLASYLLATSQVY